MRYESLNEFKKTKTHLKKYDGYHVSFFFKSERDINSTTNFLKKHQLYEINEKLIDVIIFKFSFMHSLYYLTVSTKNLKFFI